MPKALCIISLVASILVTLLFLADALLGMAGMADAAPLGYASLMMDLAFTVFGIMLIVMSFTTLRQQR